MQGRGQGEPRPAAEVTLDYIRTRGEGGAKEVELWALLDQLPSDQKNEGSVLVGDLAKRPKSLLKIAKERGIEGAKAAMHERDRAVELIDWVNARHERAIRQLLVLEHRRRTSRRIPIRAKSRTPGRANSSGGRSGSHPSRRSSASRSSGGGDSGSGSSDGGSEPPPPPDALGDPDRLERQLAGPGIGGRR